MLHTKNGATYLSPCTNINNSIHGWNIVQCIVSEVPVDILFRRLQVSYEYQWLCCVCTLNFSTPRLILCHVVQVQDYELQQQSLLKSSFHPLSWGLATASGSRLQAAVGGASSTKAPPTAPAKLALASTSQSRISTPTGARLHVSKLFDY